MPRYAGQNLAATNPAYRKEYKLDSEERKSTRYTYGNNVLVLSGKALLEQGFCMRMMPMLDESTGDFTPMREGLDDIAFGDWSRMMTCANWVGNPGVCFVMHNGNPDVDYRQNPYVILRNVAYNNQETPGLGRLFSELLARPKIMDSHVGSLLKPDKILFVSASAVFMNDQGQITLGAFSDDKKRNARVIGLRQSAWQSFLSILEVRDQKTGEHLCGDMLSTGSAKLLTVLPEVFRDSKNQKVMGVGSAGPETFFCPSYARGTSQEQFVVGYPQSRSEMTHFAFAHNTFKGQEIVLDEYVDQLKAETRTWDDLVYVPDYEEQASLMAPAFPREALEFAWQEHPEYLRTLSKGTKTFTAPAAAEADDYSEADDKPAPFIARRPSLTPQAALKPPVSKSPLTEVAPWEAEPTAEDAADVAELFADKNVVPIVPPGAVTPPPPAPSSAAPAAGNKLDSAAILARARAAASKR